MDKKIILGYTRRLLAIIPSIFFCALGVALLVSPEWGSDPLTTFEIGLSNVFHVQLGTAALVFEGIVFFVFLIIRRDLVHLGTLAWCFLIGPFENVWLDFLAPILPPVDAMSFGLKALFDRIHLPIHDHYPYSSLLYSYWSWISIK